VFEKRVARKIFGSKRDKMAGGWRKLHNEELHGLINDKCHSHNIPSLI
jgi:hypothetical protein